MKNRLVFFVMMLLIAAPLLAQEPALLQSFVYDAVIPTQGIVEGGGLYVNYSDWDVSEMIVAVRGGWAFNEKMALYGQLATRQHRPRFHGRDPRPLGYWPLRPLPIQQ